MKSCPPLTTTEAQAEGTGPAVAVCVSQADDDPGGWLLELWAHFADRDASRMFVGQATLGTVNTTARRAARVVMTTSVPGAYGYRVIVRAPLKGTTQPTKPLLVGVFCGMVPPFTFSAVNA